MEILGVLSTTEAGSTRMDWEGVILEVSWTPTTKKYTLIAPWQLNNSGPILRPSMEGVAIAGSILILNSKKEFQ